MYEQNNPQNTNNILPSSTLAIISLVAGILGFTVFPFIASIVAILTGYAARKETRSVPPTTSGDGMATAGIVMGWIQIGLTVISICCVIAYFVVMLGWLGASGELGSISG
jgi:magnesium-transporting ATPase (P-type)